MFFDGQYRRRPLQNFSGASQTQDRETIIRKAQQERQKRNEIRRQNTGAVVLQSYTRSFLNRQRCKRYCREEFDDFLRAYRDKILIDDNLAYLLRRLLFFYNSENVKDGERLIDICQYILRNPERLMLNSTIESIWLHRLKKLLDLCITQLSLSHLAQAIPLRILETFTSISSIERYIESTEHIRSYLDRIFCYLVERKYYLRLRILLEHKCPPLDGETLNAPNQISNAVLELMLRPLLLANQTIIYPQASAICQAFARHILSAPYTDPIRYYVIPCIANYAEFPFENLIISLKQLLDLYERNMNEKRQKETNVSANSMGSSFTGASAKMPNTKKENSFDDNKLSLDVEEIFTSYLMNSIMILDRHQKDLIKSKSLLGDYIQIVGKMSHKILRLPRSLLKDVTNHRNSEDSSSDEEDNDEIERMSTDNDYDESMSKNTNINLPLNSIEKEALLESIVLLNESERVRMLTDHIEEYLTNAAVLHALCEICHNLMIYNKLATIHYKLINTLAFMPRFIRAVWFTLANESSQLGFSAPLTLISKGVIPREYGVENTIPLLATFCILFGRLLPTLHDAEFREDSPLSAQTTHIRQMPFSMIEIVQLSKTLKEISMGLVELAFPDTRTAVNEHYRTVLGRSETDEEKLKQQKQIWANLLKVVVFVLNQVHTRDLRLGFCPESHWTISRLDLPLDRPTDLPLTRGSRMRGIRPFQPIRDFTREDFKNTQPMSTKQIRSITILREIPFIVPFSKRVGILQGLVAADKIRIQGNLQAFLQGPSIMVTVRRSHLYEDAYDKLRPENEPDLRLRFRVQFVSSLGLDEAGIDGGGVFREFLSELIKTAFDPNRGFFMVTTDNKLYPNPNVSDLVADYEKHYYFIGRILGKAIYENLLVELPLAEFFLTKLAGKYADVDIHQLASLDPELYKNLLYLKDYEGDVSELNLDFTVASSSFGHTQVVELIKNGQSTAVTASNRIEYLQLMADYKLNVQIRKHCVAFRKGLSNVLPVEWLYMFSNKELQILISGAEIPIDLEDMKKHCKYGGGYGPEHPSIIVFWSTLESFSDIQRRQLLKFVTSCSRPPLLGFKDLDPPFFIQNADDMERLPTASTCTNLLKLPPFKTIEQMREKLLYAVQSGVGFELS